MGVFVNSQTAGTFSNSGPLQVIYGLQPGTSASITAANAALLALYFSVPGRYIFPAGDFTADPFTVTASVAVEGAGANNAYGPMTAAPSTGEALAAGELAPSILRSSSSSADFITVAAIGVSFSRMHFQSAQGATAGAAFRVGTISTVYADGFKLLFCSFKWFFYQVRISNSSGYNLEGNYFLGARQNALYIENTANVDYGDPSIVGNQFVALLKAPAAVYVKGGGGLKITGNKFNWGGLALTDYTTYNWTRHIHVDNPAGATSVLVISGNSLETADKQSIFVDCSTAGTYNDIIVSGNQFSLAGAALGEPTIYIQGRSGAQVAVVNITGNTFKNTRGIYMQYVSNGEVGPNTWYSLGGTAPYVDLGTNTSGVNVLPQQAGDALAGQFYFRDNDANATWKSLTVGRGNRVQQHTREIPNVTSNAAYTTLFQIAVPEYGSLRFTLDLACSSSGNGQASIFCNRMIATELSSPVVALIGTDIAIARIAGTTAKQTVVASDTNPVIGDLDVQFATGNSGVGGGVYVNINVKRSAGATGSALNGTATLRVYGPSAWVQKV